MSQQNESGVKCFTSAEALARFRRVRLSSASGNDVEYADAGEPAIGVTQEGVATTTPVSVALLQPGRTFVMTASGVISEGARVYAAADGKVSATVGGKLVGRALEAAQADGDEIEVLAQADEGYLYANTADTAEVENTVTETAFSATGTVPPELLKVGDVIHVRAECKVVDNNGTDTLNLKLYVGTEEICATGAVDVADDDIGFIDALITVRAIGASGSLQASGLVALGVPGTVTAKPFRMAAATEDISAGAVITVKATWSAAHADNEVLLEQMVIEHISQRA